MATGIGAQGLRYPLAISTFPWRSRGLLEHGAGDPHGIDLRRIVVKQARTLSRADDVPGCGGSCDGAGAVYVFERNLDGAGNWGEAAILTASDAQEDDDFGASVAVDGDIVVVGADETDSAPNCDEPCPSSGSVYIFLGSAGNPSAWTEQRVLTASEPEAENNFGHSVAVTGDIVMVGDSRADNAPGCGAPCNSSGAVRFYQRDVGGPDNFAEVLILTAMDAAAGDRFGQSVALAGETLVVGSENIDDAPTCSGDCENTGAVYVFCVDLYPAVPGSIFQNGFEVSAGGQCTVL